MTAAANGISDSINRADEREERGDKAAAAAARTGKSGENGVGGSEQFLGSDEESELMREKRFLRLVEVGVFVGDTSLKVLDHCLADLKGKGVEVGDGILKRRWG